MSEGYFASERRSHPGCCRVGNWADLPMDLPELKKGLYWIRGTYYLTKNGVTMPMIDLMAIDSYSIPVPHQVVMHHCEFYKAEFPIRWPGEKEEDVPFYRRKNA